MKTYITEPSQNLAEREVQQGRYHPELCYKMGFIHRAYGWAPFRNVEWDDDQFAAYKRGHNGDGPLTNS